MNKMDTNLTGIWVNFFTAAGIPSDVSATYALTFAENRIQNDMLLDLNKEYLRDMGITRMGDVIAILRHAKQVHEVAARERVLCAGAARVPVAAVPARTQPASPMSRMVEHYTRKAAASPPPAPAATAAVKRKSSDRVEAQIGPSDNETKKARLIRFKAQARATVSTATTNKTVFARLGNSDIVIPEKVQSVTPAAKPIYARLGSKPAELVKKTDIPVPKDALKYEGILKSKPITKKVVTISTSKNNVRTIAMGGTMRADETPVSVKEKLAIPKAKSVKFSNQVQYKEIEAIKKPVVAPSPRFNTVFNKPERRLSMPETAADASVKTRLGVPKQNKNVNVKNFTITKSVFNRLGA